VNNVVTVTLNSVVKKTTLGTFHPKTGNIFVVIDVTIKNNDQNNDFDYTDSSFVLIDKSPKPPKSLSPITSQVAGSLSSPITSGMVPLKSEKTGQIVFPVKETSESYKFSVRDSTGTEISSFDNINVP